MNSCCPNILRLPLALLVCCLVVAGLFAPTLASAEAPTEPPAEVTLNPDELIVAEAPTRRLFSPEHRLELYEANRLSETRALLLSAALPGLGNFYAEQFALGAVAISAVVFSGVFIGYGLVNNQRGLASFGVGLAIVTYGVAMGSSYYGVRAYNEQLRRSLHVP